MSVYQKLGMILESKVVQKLSRKLTLKVRFWHFLMKHNSFTDSKKNPLSMYVGSWPKILLFRTHRL